jgi:PKD domain
VRHVGVAFVLAVLLWALHGPSAASDQNVPACTDEANLLNIHQFCHYSGEQLQVLITESVTGVHYTVKPMCVETQIVKENCVNQQGCAAPPDTFKYMVFRSEDGGPDEPWGTVCLGADAADHLGAITPPRVFKEMQKLDWPSAELVIQPPNGETLVNLSTNFFTTTHDATSQTITLLGRNVEITAKPVSYTWHFGDGATLESDGPGREYPDMEITHVYSEAGSTLSPSVDVTYEGSYRVNGGDPTPIPETLTVPGNPVTLSVLSATPHLVG